MSSPKQDLFSLLNSVPDRFDAVRAAICQGRINGLYPRESLATRCGCIKAHLGVETSYEERSDIEYYILGVRTGDTPENSPVMKNVLKWVDEWSLAQGSDF